MRQDLRKFNWHNGGEVPSYEEVPILYQYMPLKDEYIETFRERSLFVSDPKNFNDPFDCWAQIEHDSISPAELSKFLKQFSKSLNNIFSSDDIAKMTQVYESGGDISPLINDLRDRFRTVAENFGVLCFSSDWDSFLMWSHYAESHKGICLGYKREGMNIPSGSETPLPIQYEPPIIHLKHLFNAGSLTHETVTAFLYTKTKNWEYEREWRLSNSKPPSDKKIKWNECGAQLKEVIFGLETQQKEIDKFFALLKKMKLKVNCVLLEYNPLENQIIRSEEFTS